jgi:hypothetical protein
MVTKSATAPATATRMRLLTPAFIKPTHIYTESISIQIQMNSDVTRGVKMLGGPGQVRFVIGWDG